MAEALMITTKDNPYDYFKNFDQWYIYDVSHGYNTCGRLARNCFTSQYLSDADNQAEINRAVQEMFKYDFVGMYKIVSMQTELAV